MSNEARILNPTPEHNRFPVYAKRVQIVVDWADGQTSELVATGNIRFGMDLDTDGSSDWQELSYFGSVETARIPTSAGTLDLDMSLKSIDKITEGYTRKTVAKDSTLSASPDMGTLVSLACSLCGRKLGEEDAAWSIGPQGNQPLCGGGCCCGPGPT